MSMTHPTVTQADYDILRLLDVPASADHLLMMAYHRSAAEARIAALEEEDNARLREDAERWRAFFGSERFYVMGAVGFDWEKSCVEEPRNESNWLHFTLNVWDRHPAKGDEQDVQGRLMLLSYVDYIRANPPKGSTE